MELLRDAFDFFRHLDDQIQHMITRFGNGTYWILAAIIFAETGLVFLPFLPGDSLLFAAGIFAHPDRNGLNVWILLFGLWAAAVVGDNVNYHVGKYLGPRMFKNESSRFLKKSHLLKTEAFFERYGAKTILLARWVPIVRTIAPFVAGMGAMPYRTFTLYNIVGGFFWVWICVGAGYFFGQITWVKDRFEIAMLALILLSVVPIFIEARKAKKEAKERGDAEDRVHPEDYVEAVESVK